MGVSNLYHLLLLPCSAPIPLQIDFQPVSYLISTCLQGQPPSLCCLSPNALFHMLQYGLPIGHPFCSSFFLPVTILSRSGTNPHQIDSRTAPTLSQLPNKLTQNCFQPTSTCTLHASKMSCCQLAPKYQNNIVDQKIFCFVYI